MGARSKKNPKRRQVVFINRLLAKRRKPDEEDEGVATGACPNARDLATTEADEVWRCGSVAKSGARDVATDAFLQPIDIIEFQVDRQESIFEKCAQLYESGLSYSEVATALGISKTWANFCINAYQKSLRPSSDLHQRIAKRKKYRRPKVIPFGYVFLKGGLQQHPQEQAIIQKIFSLWKSGHSLSSIARELNTLGVKSRRNAKWHHLTVSKILRRSKRFAQSCSGRKR